MSYCPESLRRDALRRHRHAPAITYYRGSGVRMELSAATLDNWVAKAGAYLADEFDLESDAVVRLDLPLHWLVPVWCQAVWSRGWAVTVTDTGNQVTATDLVITTAERVGLHRDALDVVACATNPFGTPLGAACPPGAADALADLRIYPDQVSLPLPAPDATVVVADGVRIDGPTAIARADALLDPACRRPLSTVLPDSCDGLLLTSLSWLCRDGAVVLVAESESADLATICAQEHTDCRV